MIDHLGIQKHYREFEQVAVPHMPILHNYALHLTKNLEDAKDLVQETFFKAFRAWSGFEAGTNIKGWLYQIMRNSYINLYRKNQREPRKTDYNDDQLYRTVSQPGSFDPQILRGKSYNEIFEDEVAHSIDLLPDDFKTVVLLSDYEDLSYEEIADIVDCPIGTVRSRLHRARRQLQKSLSHYAKDNGFIMNQSD